MDGCNALMHTASPFYTAQDKDELVRPALAGTETVLRVASLVGIEDVVLTSSTAAIYGWYGKYDEHHVMTAADWSDETRLIDAKNWYCLSKILAEKKAWSDANHYGMNLSVMNPCLIVGPKLSPALNTSSHTILKYMTGELKTIPNATKCLVDVRDVADAHVKALAVGAWNKRYLLVGGCPAFSEVATIVRNCLPASCKANVPTELGPIGPPTLGAPPPHSTKYDVSPAVTDLKMKFIDPETMVRATVSTLIEWDHFDPAGPVSSKTAPPS